MSKPREFELSSVSDSNPIDHDVYKNIITKGSLNKGETVIVIEKSRADKLVNALVSIAGHGRQDTEAYWFAHTRETCAELLARDTRLARKALKEYRGEE